MLFTQVIRYSKYSLGLFPGLDLRLLFARAPWERACYRPQKLTNGENAFDKSSGPTQICGQKATGRCRSAV